MAWLCLLVGVLGWTSARAELPADALATYENEAVGVRTIVPLGRDGASLDRTASPSWDAFQGRDHHPIDDEAFFRIVGRDDLARRYHRKLVVKRSLTVGGGALLAGGLLFSLVTYWIEHPGGQPAVGCLSACSQSPGISPGWGLAVAGSGLLSLFAGGTVDPNPIGASEADGMAREHDGQLKERSGLSDQAAR